MLRIFSNKHRVLNKLDPRTSPSQFHAPIKISAAPQNAAPNRHLTII